MTLGEKLKNIVAEEEARKREAIRKEEERRANLRSRERSERMLCVQNIRNHITTQLNAGNIPLHKIHGTERKAWVNRANGHSGDKVADQDVWDSLVAWLKGEGLLINVGYGHDGMGMDDWLEITVKLIPGPEVEAD